MVPEGGAASFGACVIHIAFSLLVLHSNGSSHHKCQTQYVPVGHGLGAHIYAGCICSSQKVRGNVSFSVMTDAEAWSYKQ